MMKLIKYKMMLYSASAEIIGAGIAGNTIGLAGAVELV
jgi:hypothetical protein